ncbi:gamma-glutamyl-gamma-aminobutyrate hydrolase family protein [Algoriphagus halophytocola]|uniref:Gamma-glutamyl-gamma-aminobutyrate hydrolase family protein n=1 Tax=Algoriphagus halophytocola TaxID=2991499 RepID=A0ABY6MGF0_9BACT|nr:MULTISPECIES: gamma-glutamyl-gamma-aminobutyrate hydrolase family protein [unclassified Algoriphagus]UZD22049.1 gamma-glutamyl-gamma-aminobutyrate hydrolase family protein [Algoriphagus sp. TR-M5]WBL43300.1 gamma-glutamyl-gamma-aminobutyrate hydrolase family protein [Algoriphagus sp. TR-M9]
MLLLIDNFDSFSHMLADLLRQTGEELLVVRNDTALEELKKVPFEGLVLSPGPGTPAAAGNLNAILAYYFDKVPILGVCLGHQAIGEFFGAKLVKNRVPTHGKVHLVRKTKPHCFISDNLPGRFHVTRYHSLQLRDLPDVLEVILETEEGEVMGMVHRKLPIVGIQYHPEAHLTAHGLELVKAWVARIYVEKETPL